MFLNIQTAYGLLADFVVSVHFLYVMFVLFGQITIIIGWIFKWEFIRNPYFRIIHFIAILIVAVQALTQIPCPLTVWENDLRRLAGQSVDVEISFIGRLLRLFVFYDFPKWFFTVLHVSFASLVLITLILVPPRFKKRIT